MRLETLFGGFEAFRDAFREAEHERQQGMKSRIYDIYVTPATSLFGLTVKKSAFGHIRAPKTLRHGRVSGFLPLLLLSVFLFT